MKRARSSFRGGSSAVTAASSAAAALRRISESRRAAERKAASAHAAPYRAAGGAPRPDQRLDLVREGNGEIGKPLDRDIVLAGRATQRKQPLLDAFEFIRIEIRRAHGLVEASCGFIKRDQRGIQRPRRLGDEIGG